MFCVRKLENCADNSDADDHEECIEATAATNAWEYSQNCVSNDERTGDSGDGDGGWFHHINSEGAKDNAKDTGDADNFATDAKLVDGDGECGKECK